MPGSKYGETAYSMRFSFANAAEDVERAGNRIRAALMELPEAR